MCEWTKPFAVPPRRRKHTLLLAFYIEQQKQSHMKEPTDTTAPVHIFMLQKRVDNKNWWSCRCCRWFFSRFHSLRFCKMLMISVNKWYCLIMNYRQSIHIHTHSTRVYASCGMKLMCWFFAEKLFDSIERWRCYAWPIPPFHWKLIAILEWRRMKILVFSHYRFSEECSFDFHFMFIDVERLKTISGWNI